VDAELDPMIPHFVFGQPVTLSQLRGEIESWLERPVQDGLPLSVENLLTAVREAEVAVRQNLESGQQAAELEPHFLGAAEAYQEMGSCLEAIAKGVRASETGGVAKELGRLVVAGDRLRQCTEEVERWLSQPQARCPQCGFGSQNLLQLCPDCRLELLYPDLSPDQQASKQFLTLGPDYLSVYKTYLAVLAGQSTLSELRLPLERLHAIVAESASLVRSHAQVKSACAEILAGVEQMAACFVSREAEDLNKGWFRVFRAAGELQVLLQPFLQESGLSSPQKGSDSFELSE
jgi:hypothetical protein